MDEGHRSQASTLHANLLRSLPNYARIAFTGTPIMIGDANETVQIFGDLRANCIALQRPSGETTGSRLGAACILQRVFHVY